MSVITWFFALLGPRALDRLASALTFVSYDVLKVRRSLIESNILTAYGPSMPASERTKLGRTAFYHFVLTALEFLNKAHSGGLADDVRFEGREHIDQALAQGKGAYILCIHMSSWEAMGGAVTANVCPSYVIVKKVGSPGINRFIVDARRRNHFYCIERSQKGDAYRGIVSTLNRGEIVGFVMDQSRPGEKELPFFGVPTKTNSSLAAIWQRRPAPIIPSYITRTGVHQYTVTFLPEVVMHQSKSLKNDVIINSLRFNQVVEEMIISCPEQYFWLHDRWKFRQQKKERKNARRVLVQEERSVQNP